MYLDEPSKAIERAVANDEYPSFACVGPMCTHFEEYAFRQRSSTSSGVAT